jgi:hypothetical protein
MSQRQLTPKPEHNPYVNGGTTTRYMGLIAMNDFGYEPTEQFASRPTPDMMPGRAEYLVQMHAQHHREQLQRQEEEMHAAMQYAASFQPTSPPRHNGLVLQTVPVDPPPYVAGIPFVPQQRTPQLHYGRAPNQNDAQPVSRYNQTLTHCLTQREFLYALAWIGNLTRNITEEQVRRLILVATGLSIDLEYIHVPQKLYDGNDATRADQQSGQGNALVILTKVQEETFYAATRRGSNQRQHLMVKIEARNQMVPVVHPAEAAALLCGGYAALGEDRFVQGRPKMLPTVEKARQYSCNCCLCDSAFARQKQQAKFALSMNVQQQQPQQHM